MDISPPVLNTASNAGKLVVTASMGISEWQGKQDSIASMERRRDQPMYGA